MRKHLWIAAAAAAVSLAGCTLVEKAATPENLARVAEAINDRIDDSDELSAAGKAKLKEQVAEIIAAAAVVK